MRPSFYVGGRSWFKPAEANVADKFAATNLLPSPLAQRGERGRGEGCALQHNAPSLILSGALAVARISA